MITGEKLSAIIAVMGTKSSSAGRSTTSPPGPPKQQWLLVLQLLKIPNGGQSCGVLRVVRRRPVDVPVGVRLQGSPHLRLSSPPRQYLQPDHTNEHRHEQQPGSPLPGRHAIIQEWFDELAHLGLTAAAGVLDFSYAFFISSSLADLKTTPNISHAMNSDKARFNA